MFEDCFLCKSCLGIEGIGGIGICQQLRKKNIEDVDKVKHG
jgi:hypothetical protein